MRLTEEQYELIEAYLRNDLSASDRALFEVDMFANAELRVEVNRQRDLRLGLRAIGIERVLERTRAQYKATATEAEPNHAVWQPTIIRPLSTWRYWAVAASTVLILGIGYFSHQQMVGKQSDIAYTDTLSDELTKGFPSDNVSPDIRNRFLDALRSYKARKYDQVITRLKALPTDKQTLYYKDYFLGLSYLANKQSAKAIPLLNNALATPSTPLRQKVEWCLALAYVRNGQNEQALPILKQISANKAHPFQLLSKRVLQKIG